MKFLFWVFFFYFYGTNLLSDTNIWDQDSILHDLSILRALLQTESMFSFSYLWGFDVFSTTNEYHFWVQGLSSILEQILFGIHVRSASL